MNVSGKAFSLTLAGALVSLVAFSSALRAATPAEGTAALPADASSTSQHPMPGHGGPMSGVQSGMEMPHAGGTDMMQKHQQMMARMHSMHGGAPLLPGQDAFGAIGEIVAILETDPATDWSKVDLEALRQHLIDMNDVTLNTVAVAKPVDRGIEITVTGTGRTLAAIQRMVPEHAKEIDGQNGWSAKARTISDGVLLSVTSNDPKQVAHIRGLGFIGIMVSGAHHQAHHLAMAKGEPMHGH